MSEQSTTICAFSLADKEAVAAVCAMRRDEDGTVTVLASERGAKAEAVIKFLRALDVQMVSNE